MWKEMSDPAILERIGKRIKNTRIRQELTQEELAKLSGISVLTLINIEKGKSVSMVLFISVMRTLGLLENLELLVPEIKISPVVLKKLQGKSCGIKRLVLFIGIMKQILPYLITNEVSSGQDLIYRPS